MPSVLAQKREHQMLSSRRPARADVTAGILVVNG